MRIFENQNLEDVLKNIECLPKTFVVAHTRKDGAFDSAAVYLFDKRRILHVVSAVTETPHIFLKNLTASMMHALRNQDQII